MNHNSVNAKVRAMKGNILNYNEYIRLISLGNLEQIANELRQHKAYKDVIKIESSNIIYNRGLIEEKLIMSNFMDYNKIYAFIGNCNTRKYLSIIGLQHKIRILKIIICAVYDERDIHLDKEYYNLQDYLNLDIQRLEASRSIRELIDNLKDTEFYYVLNTVYSQTTNLFDFNMKLDLYYYTKLYKLQNKYLDKHSKKILSKVNGVEVDIQNIMLIYRLKNYYNIKPDFIYTYLIPYYFKITNKQIKFMVEANTLEELQEEINNTKYKVFFEKENNIDKVYKKIMIDAYKKATKLHKNSLVQVTSYLYLKELEVRNLISLIEGVRYKLSSNEIMEYLTIY